jgi:hypothetical protein
MNIQLASWADLGYRKLGPLPSNGGGVSPADLARLFTVVAGYQATPDHWIRLPERRKGIRTPKSIEIVSVIDKRQTLDDERLAFLERHAQSDWAKVCAELPQFRMPFEEVVEMVNDAENAEERWRAFYFLSCAINLAAPESLRQILRSHLLPAFFRLYPQGKVVVLRYDTRIDSAAAAMRSAYGAALAPLPALAADATSGVSTLREWHLMSLSHLMPALLDFFNYLFYPLVGGARANLPGMAILFLTDPMDEHVPGYFPRNWLGFASASAVFAQERTDPLEVVRDQRGPAAQRAGHHRFLHTTRFSADDRIELLRWYVGRLNRMLFELTDVCNFTEGLLRETAIDPVFGYEHQITIDRLFRKTLLAMSLDVAPVANLMSFEIADLYDTLSLRFTKTSQDAAFFKELFHTKDAPAKTGRLLGNMPQPFAGYFADMAMQAYHKIEDTVRASVWRNSKLTATGIMVQNKTLTAETEVPLPEFVGESMRAYRNAHHGYFSAGDRSKRPSRFLFMVDGNLPVEMSALPVLWWLSYLADPTFVGWEYLPLGAFD